MNSYSYGRKDSPEWVYSPIDGNIYSANFHHDAALKLTGDFVDDEEKTAYAEKLCALLNAPSSSGPGSESPDEWYARERAAFIAWWESEGQEKFSETPTIAAGAGWFARAEKESK